MNRLVNSLKEEDNVTLTENGAISNASTLNPIVDFFALAPNCLGEPKKALLSFKMAYAADRRMAIRTLLWVRDVREGAGARAPFRECLKWLVLNSPKDAINVLERTVFLGRWDDLLSVWEMQLPIDIKVNKYIFHTIKKALDGNDFLCAKWMPRKGPIAYLLMKNFNMTPKQWRKTLVNICSKHFLVETEMCENNWTEIEYKKVPSVAFARYKKAFGRHDYEGFGKFLNSVVSGEAKINASAIFPHDIIRNYTSPGSQEQWNLLPNYLSGDDTGIVVADVSGSMSSPASGSVSNLDVSISLAIYMAERARGPFKDHFITFSNEAKLVHIPSTLSLNDKVSIAKHSQWDMNTNIQSVFNLILETSVKHSIEENDMPKFVTIISDMQFDYCGRSTNLDLIRAKYEKAGYKIPKLVFWNVASRGDKPVTIKDSNTALISGFSPAILKTVFEASNLNPLRIFLNTVLNPRYDFKGCKVKVNNEI